MFLLTTVCIAFIMTLGTQALLLEFKADKDLDVWKPVGGEWKIKGGLLEGKTTGYQDLMLNISGSDKWTDYTFEVKGNLTAGRIWGVCFRYVDTMTNYRLNLYEDLDATNNLYIYKRVSGSFSEVFKTPVGKIDFNKWYTLKLTITKNTMQAYLDNDLKIEVEDKNNPIEQGTVALEGETNTNFQVEYFKIDGKGIQATSVDAKGKLASLWGDIKR
ncbi:MAG: family 16 glycoside hydrolase [Candidatus Poribacteria bacterium]